MNCKEMILRSNTPDAASTEIMYEIAAARADRLDLIRLSFNNENVDTNKLFSSAIKLLKMMKQKGSIQFFATEDSFRRSTTEAIFLLNKYADAIQTTGECKFIYIKL